MQRVVFSWLLTAALAVFATLQNADVSQSGVCKASTCGQSLVQSKKVHLNRNRDVDADKSEFAWFSGIAFGHECKVLKYLQEYKVALKSWRATNNTIFKPHLVVHVPPGADRTDAVSMMGNITWLREFGVHVVFHTLSIYSDMHDLLLHEMPNPNGIPLLCAAGAFLKLDLPSIIDESRLFESGRLVESHVLWTDLDVMWWSRVELKNLPLPWETPVAYSAELDQDGLKPINSGVVWFHVPRFREVHPRLIHLGFQRGDFHEGTSNLAYFYARSKDQDWFNFAFIYKNATAQVGASLLDPCWNFKFFWKRRTTSPIILLHTWGIRPGPFFRCFVSERTADPMACPDEVHRNTIMPVGVQKEIHQHILKTAIENDGGELAEDVLQRFDFYNATNNE